MSTLRKWLDDEKFNWQAGRIIWHQTPEDEAPGGARAIAAWDIGHASYVLDIEFNSGYGGPECPRFIARDDVAIYFPSQYDGSTCLEKIYLDFSKYLDVDEQTPYPGG